MNNLLLNPFFSIIIPSFNRGSFLTSTILSVKNQKFINWELIIVDDGSTDDTKEVVNEFLNDNRIKYFYQDNSERSAARNKGISVSLGDFICFMDSDNIMDSERLNILYKSLKNNMFLEAVYYTDIIYFSPNNNNTFIKYGNHFSTPVEINELINKIIATPQLCISKKVLSEFKFDERISIGEDLELLFRIVQKYPLLYLENNVTITEINHENRSVSFRSKSSIKQLRTLKIMFSKNHPANKVDKSLKNKLLSEVYYNASVDYFKNFKTKALKFILLSLWKDPLSDKTLFKLNLLMSFILLRKKRINKLLN